MAVESRQRSNEEWLGQLRAPENGEAIKDLRAYVRASLGRAFGGRADVNESDLDDFAQDALIKILDKLDTFRGDSRLTTWATAIAVRVALTALRRRRWNHVPLETLEFGTASVDGASHVASPESPVGAAQRNDLIAALQHAIEHRLTDRQRAVITAELQGMPSAELAEQLGSNANALYKVYHDARKKLRRSLEEAGFSAQDVRTVLTEASKE